MDNGVSISPEAYVPGAIMDNDMAKEPLFEWYGMEYESPERSTDWYWALGIIAIGLTIACIIFGNVLLALVVIAAAVSAGILAAKKQQEHRFRLTDHGLQIDDRLYHFDTMLHFSVLEYLEKDVPPTLSIKTRSIFSPHLLIPLGGVDADAVYSYMSSRIEEGRHDESVMDRLVDMFQL